MLCSARGFSPLGATEASRLVAGLTILLLDVCHRGSRIFRYGTRKHPPLSGVSRGSQAPAGKTCVGRFECAHGIFCLLSSMLIHVKTLRRRPILTYIRVPRVEKMTRSFVPQLPWPL